MVELAQILRQYGQAYRKQHGERMLPSHRRTLDDTEQCRTEVMGGQVFSCPDCDETRYSYHSCQNRYCPKCQQEAGEEWLVRQQELLLPVPYFLLTFTLPDPLRQLARSHQKQIYSLLFRTAAAATQELAQDPRFVGGQIGMVGVLHTWTQDLHFHPHVHFLVPGGGLSPEGEWMRARNHFFIHVKPLSILFRAKFREALRKTELFDQVPTEVWQQDWVVHCKSVGDGVGALKYLAPYIFRVAISHRRILSAANGQVTFTGKDRSSGQRHRCTVPAHEFIRRFLQHVLPKGFVKVRYFGLFSPRHRLRLHQLRLLLGTHITPQTELETEPAPTPGVVLCCPTCGQAMRPVQRLRPRNRWPP